MKYAYKELDNGIGKRNNESELQTQMIFFLRNREEEDELYESVYKTLKILEKSINKTNEDILGFLYPI